jgi:hypothetical protein
MLSVLGLADFVDLPFDGNIIAHVVHPFLTIHALRLLVNVSWR